MFSVVFYGFLWFYMFLYDFVWFLPGFLGGFGRDFLEIFWRFSRVSWVWFCELFGFSKVFMFFIYCYFFLNQRYVSFWEDCQRSPKLSRVHGEQAVLTYPKGPKWLKHLLRRCFGVVLRVKYLLRRCLDP